MFEEKFDYEKSTDILTNRIIKPIQKIWIYIKLLTIKHQIN